MWPWSRKDKDDEEARLKADGFDAGWYSRTYPDVALSGLSPQRHYLRYGQAIGRDPAPDLPIEFFREVLRIPPSQDVLARLRERERAGTAYARKSETGLVLVAASRLARTGRDDLAIELAERWLPETLQYSTAILRANAALRRRNRVEWLAQLNAYLGHFGVAPIHLTSGSADLWPALAADAPAADSSKGPLVSVIMAAWNAERTIDYAVRSILSQTWRNLELLIVDDRSDDATWSVIQRIAAQDSRVRVFRNDVNTGPYVAKNIALSQANGFFITGHDADDWAHPERIERQVRFCLDNNAPACLASMLRMSPDGEFVRLNRISGRVHDGASRAAFIGLMADAQLMHGALGGWDEVRVGGDSELIARLERMLKGPLPSPIEPVMLCLDNPEGLTNHVTLGYSETGQVSPHRIAYMTSFRAAHMNLTRDSARYDIPMVKRPFPAPEPMRNAVHAVAQLMQGYAAQGLNLRQDVEADVAIVTNLAYRGGNTASTLEEIEFLAAQGLKVAVVHTPTLRQTWHSAAPGYATAPARVVNWTRVGSLRAPVVIVRNPVVVAAPAFAALAPRIEAEDAFVVMNNSRLLAGGGPAYETEAFLNAVRSMSARRVTYCPAGPLMRAELDDLAARTGESLPQSPRDWLPTLDVSRYLVPPRASMTAPFRLGRHARDGAEKWPLDAKAILAAYPGDPDFQVSILGGAAWAEKRLGQLPANWDVLAFGEMSPRDYLSRLDAFVYYPDPGLIEGFGRAIAEAMLAGVPVILPDSFRPVFGPRAFYGPPEDVAGIVRAIASDDGARVDFLTEVQEVTRTLHDARSIASRLAGTAINLQVPEVPEPALSDRSLNWRRSVLTAAGLSAE